MDREEINALGDELYEALRGNCALLPLTDRVPGIQVNVLRSVTFVGE